MLSRSAAQAAVESKHPVSACDATTVDTFSANNLVPNGVVKRSRSHRRCHRLWGPSTPFGFRLTPLRMTDFYSYHTPPELDVVAVFFRARAAALFLHGTIVLSRFVATR